MSIVLNILEVLVVLVPMLLGVAFVTIVERKMLAAAQRRVGPNVVGLFGIMQPFHWWGALKFIFIENKTICWNSSINKVLISSENPYFCLISRDILNDHTFCILPSMMIWSLNSQIINIKTILLILTLALHYLVDGNSSVSPVNYLAFSPFISTDPAKLYRQTIRYMSWPNILRFKKHKALAHYRDVYNNINSIRKPWIGVSGIYKITFIHFRLFTYFGSSTDLGSRMKYHYYNSPKQRNLLGLFLKVFGWSHFSITIIETCSPNEVRIRENWYLSTFQPLLNVLMNASTNPKVSGKLSLLTPAKISASLMGRQDSLETRDRKSKSKQGANNLFFGKGPGIKALNLAAEKAGIKVYAYDTSSFTLVNGKAFLFERPLMLCLFHQVHYLWNLILANHLKDIIIIVLPNHKHLSNSFRFFFS